MNQIKRNPALAATPAVWVGQNPMIIAAASAASHNCEQIRIEVDMAIGLSLKIFRVESGFETLIISEVFARNTMSMANLRIAQALRDLPNNFFVLEYNTHSTAFWARFFERTECEFTLFFPEQWNVNWKQWAFICAATGRLGATQDIAAWWKSKFIFDIELTDTPDMLAENVKKQYNCLKNRLLLPVRKPSDETSNTITLISYYFPPIKTVAMQRLDYWHAQMDEIAASMGMNTKIHVLTAFNHYNHPENVTVVRDFGDDLPYEGKFKTVFNTLTKSRINTIGVSWSQILHKAIQTKQSFFQTDAVLISGNPFYYFDLGELYRNLFQTAVILDFRDPFAGHPRFNYTNEQRMILRDIERSYVAHADGVLAVNNQCLALIVKNRRTKYVDIANGYDERITDQTKPAKRKVPKSKIRFIYAGKFYHDCEADNFVSKLDPKRHVLDHFGLRQGDHDRLDKFDAFKWHGITTYEGVISEIKSSDTGMIFTGGKPFEQLTKIFDYIAADIDVVMVTEGKARTGGLYDLTRDLDGIYWVENKPKEIEAFLASYKPKPRKRKTRSDYSRWKQAEKLLELINSLIEGKQVSGFSKFRDNQMAMKKVEVLAARKGAPKRKTGTTTKAKAGSKAAKKTNTIKRKTGSAKSGPKLKSKPASVKSKTTTSKSKSTTKAKPTAKTSTAKKPATAKQRPIAKTSKPKGKVTPSKAKTTSITKSPGRKTSTPKPKKKV